MDNVMNGISAKSLLFYIAAQVAFYAGAIFFKDEFVRMLILCASNIMTGWYAHAVIADAVRKYKELRDD